MRFAYHQLGSGFSLGLNRITKARFETHLQFFYEMGFSSHPDFKIIFDDGYESVYSIAFPIMERYKFKGLVFPVAGYIGKDNLWDVNFFGLNKSKHLSEENLIDLLENGWEIGSHGLFHKSITTQFLNELKCDLEESKYILENLLGIEINCYAPPFGMMDSHHIPTILQYYDNIYIPNNRNISHTNVIKRHSVYSIDNIKSLDRKLNLSKLELMKENIIQNCAHLTVLVKEIL